MSNLEDDGFRHDRYAKAFESINDLSGRLPEDSVVSLAREVLARVSDLAGASQDEADLPSADAIDVLAVALISRDQDAGSEIIAELQSRDIPSERIYLDYLALAARKLGEWWSSDKATFVEVTLGTGRIYAIMRAMAEDFEPTKKPTAKAAMFCAVPGETHSLGVRMAADLFRKRGWRVDLKVGMTHDELIADIGNSQHLLIGLSGGGLHAIADMARLVIAIRIKKPKARILVSGNVVSEARELVELMELDAISEDFEAAAADLEELWQQIENAS